MQEDLNIKKRRGFFSLTNELIHLDPATAMSIFAHTLITKAEHSFMFNVIEYQAYSYLFDELAESEATPYYTFSFSESGEIIATRLNV